MIGCLVPISVVDETLACNDNELVELWQPKSCPSERHANALASIATVENFYEKSIAELQHLFREDKLFMAYDEGTFALQVLHLCGSNDAKTRWRNMTQLPLWVEIVTRVGETKQLLAEFANNDGWTMIRQSDRFETRYRRERGKDTHSFRCSGEVRAPLLHLVAVLYEVDLFSTWFPFCKYGKELLTISRFHKIVQIEIMGVWPVANRDLVCDAYGVNLLESNQVVIFLRSINSHPYVRLPKASSSSSRVVRALIHIGGFLVEPVSENESRISLLINTDPKLDSVPKSLLNWITGKLIHVILSQMEKAARFDINDQSCPYVQRLQTNTDVYDHVRETLRNHKF